MSEIHKEGHFGGMEVIYCHDSPFNIAAQTILEESDELITARSLAIARMETGKMSSFSYNGSYINEGSLFIPRSKSGKRIWLRKSLVLDHLEDAVKNHDNKSECLLPKFNHREFLESIGKDNYCIIKDFSYIPTTRFGEDERTSWLFQEAAVDYGLFLNDTGISKIYIYMNNDDKYIDIQHAPFINQLWVRKISGNSNIDGDDKYLINNNMVRGIRYKKQRLNSLH
ncbi:MAG TPA: hypothetical protein VEC16_05670 [Alphaproteobacteria bacterium]|nr:hypothetical protein [Alphaproteobacteria bacterium]